MQAQRQQAQGFENPGNDDPGTTWDQAMRRGDFATAWAVSDQVLAARDPLTRDDPRVPYHERWVWDGQAFDGRRVLVRCYHGLGDTLQFCRYLAAAAPPGRGGGAGGAAGADAAAPGPARRGPDAAVRPRVPLAAIGLRPRDHGAGACAPPAARSPTLSEHDRGPPARHRVLLAGRRLGPGAQRSGPALRGLAAAMDGISLQRGPDAAALGLPDPLGGSMDLVALAGLVAGLRAVVTVDTMVAHLAGALGRPTHLLLKHAPDWRWGTDGLWYATVRGYRQSRAGDWSDPVRRLAATLGATLDPQTGS